MKEKQNRIPHVKTKDELESEASGRYSYAPSYDFLYSGYLQFVIDDWEAPRKNWNDTNNKKIETEVGEIVVAIIETAESLRILREQRHQEELRRRQSELERMKLQDLRDNEMKKVQQLETRANDYKRAMEIMKYVNALEKELPRMNCEGEYRRLSDYIQWARGKIDWLNPLTNKGDPILGTKNLLIANKK